MPSDQPPQWEWFDGNRAPQLGDTKHAASNMTDMGRGQTRIEGMYYQPEF